MKRLLFIAVLGIGSFAAVGAFADDPSLKKCETRVEDGGVVKEITCKGDETTGPCVGKKAGDKVKADKVDAK